MAVCGFSPLLKSFLPSGQMHPFGMAVWGDYVYWSDWQHLAVQRVNRKTGMSTVFIRI